MKKLQNKIKLLRSHLQELRMDKDFQKLPKEEQNNAELVHCGCENEEEVRYVTRDMAIDAGDLSMEGSIY